MRINLNIESRDFVSIPAGTYLCHISEIRQRKTKNDDDLWAMRLVVAEGEFIGRHAAWDNLVFSERGLARVRRVFEALGLPHQGTVEVEPEDVADKYAFVRIRPVEFTRPNNGEVVKRNEVHYDGYTATPEGFVPPLMLESTETPRPGTGGDTDGPPLDMNAIPF